MGGIGLSMSSSSDACLFEAFLSDGFCSSFLNGEILRDRLACGAGLSELRAGSGRGSSTSRELKLSSCTGSGSTLARPSSPGSLRTFGAGAFCSCWRPWRDGGTDGSTNARILVGCCPDLHQPPCPQ